MDKIFLIPLAVGLLAQVTKFIYFGLRHGWDWRYSVTYGHMPSAHTAFVTSLVTTIALFEGIHTPAFAVAVVFAILVIFDALRLRVYMGEHAVMLNKIVKELKLPARKFPRIKERVGHKPEEVAGGALFGAVVTWILASLFA